MERILEDKIFATPFVYFDDVIVSSKLVDQIEQLGDLLIQMRKCGLKFKAMKYVLFAAEGI